MALLLSLCAQAHEMRPAFLQVQTAGDGLYNVVWKQPVLGDRRLPLTPQLPTHCAPVTPQQSAVIAAALIERWQVDCGSTGLDSQTITIDGLSRTLTDVMVQIDLPNGERINALLKPSAASMTVGSAANDATLSDYLMLGVEHLLLGIDHILFVLALLLIIGPHRPLHLLKTITAFTLAHSITLALSALQWVQLPQGPVEAVIALSIVFLAYEIVRDDPTTLTQRRPWLVAFAFGLLHGFGFAGALTEIGLPQTDVLWALLLFNLGVELGQLLVVIPAIGLLYLWHRMAGERSLPRWAAQAPVYLLGMVATYWLLDRVAFLGELWG